MATDRIAGRGRPRGTSARALEVIALRLFADHGFEEITVERIATAAGVSRRTFFRYFDSKSDVLWHNFDNEVRDLRAALAASSPDEPPLEAIRAAVLAVNRYTAADVPELRTRMGLLATTPALAASALAHYDSWELAVIEFAASRLGQQPYDLVPTAIGRATLAVCRAAYELWLRRADADLTAYLDRALRLMAAGFHDPDRADAVIARTSRGAPNGHARR